MCTLELIFLFSVLLLFIVCYDIVDLMRLLSRTSRVSSKDPSTFNLSMKSIHSFPRVSVIIPAFNVQKTITRTLESVFESDYQDYEVLVVDDGSQDQTVAEVENWCEETSHSVKISKKDHGGKASAANLGALESQGEVLLFLDADSYVIPHFIEISLNKLEKSGKDAIDYVQQVANPQATLWTRIAEFERKILELHPDNFGALFVIKRDLHTKYPFTCCLSPQYDLDLRLSRANLLLFDPTPVVFSDEPVSFKRMFERKVRWTYGFLEVTKMNGFKRRRDRFAFTLRMSLSFIGLFLMIIPTILGFATSSIFFTFPIFLLLLLLIKNSIIAIYMRLSILLSFAYTLYQLLILNLAVVFATVRFMLRRPPTW